VREDKMRRLAPISGSTALGITALAVAGCAATAATTGSVTGATTTATRSEPGTVGQLTRIAGWPVLGMFEVKGGPSGAPSTRPLSGVVMFRDKAGPTTDITAGATGHFTGNLPAGTYTVTARTEQIRQQNPNGSYSDPPCTAPMTVVVRPKQATRITLVCFVP